MSANLEKFIDNHALAIRETFEEIEAGKEHPDALSAMIYGSGEDEVEPGLCKFFYVLAGGGTELHLIVTVDTTDSGHIRITETKVRAHTGPSDVVERIVGTESPYTELAVHMLEELGPVKR